MGFFITKWCSLLLNKSFLKNVKFWWVICWPSSLLNEINRRNNKCKNSGVKSYFDIINRKNIPDTKFEVLAPYLVSHNVLITNAEGGDFRSLPKLLKKMPEFILLGKLQNRTSLLFDDQFLFSLFIWYHLCKCDFKVAHHSWIQNEIVW